LSNILSNIKLKFPSVVSLSMPIPRKEVDGDGQVFCHRHPIKYPDATVIPDSIFYYSSTGKFFTNSFLSLFSFLSSDVLQELLSQWEILAAV
jgi:hypothetical protein